jgi:catechol 2,3-dioxygenase-like lactoylglutathione lyase family enzyme
MSREVQVTFDCGDPAALAEFWATVLGYVPQPPPPGFPTWDAALGPRIFFQRVPEGKSAKNRVHLDVRAASGLEGDERMAALEAEAARLAAMGAAQVERFEPGPMDSGFIVMRDPEGNEFCLD